MTEKQAYFLSAARWRSDADIYMAATTAAGVQLEFRNAVDKFIDDTRLQVNVNCAKKAGTPVSSREYDADDVMRIIFTVDHPAGCLGGGGDDDGDGGLSGGSIFLILFFVAVFVYVVAGCVWNWKRNGLSLGREACPNKAVWLALKDNCVAGVLFTKGGCKRSGAYQTGDSSSVQSDL